MMMLHRSASESAFSKTHRTHAPAGLARQDSSNTEDGGLTLVSTPSIRTLPGRSSFTTPPRRGGSLRVPEPSESTPSSSTSRLTGSQQLRKPASGSLAELQRHRALDKTVSQQTVLSSSSTTAFSKTAWASENSVDTTEGRKSSRKSSKSSRRHLVLPPPSGDEDEDGYEPIYFSTRDSSSSVKPSNQNQPQSFTETPTSSHKKRDQDGVRSHGVNPGSPNRQTNPSRYHPRNEKFPIPNSPDTRKSPSVKSPDRHKDDVFNFSHTPKTPPASKHTPSTGDPRSPISKDVTPVQGRGRKPSREVLLEFPSDTNINSRPQGRVAQHTDRVKEERRERVQNSTPPGRQVIRTAQSVPRLDGELAVTTPTNSPDRSTRPRSVVDARDRPRHKPNRGSKMCDFFFFFRWGKKKEKRSPSDEEGQSDDNSRSRSRGKSSRFYTKSGDSASPSGSRDKHSRGRSRSRSKDKNPVSSKDRQHRNSRHHDREDRHQSQHHRPSSSTSRPLRTPTTGGQSTEPQYRQYRHHHRREQQHHKNQHHSPDENRPPPQQYTPSRQKRERPKKQQHRRGRHSGKPSADDARSGLSDGTVGLRHEDLPLHPSIANALVSSKPKTPKDKSAAVSGSYLKNTFVRAPGTGGVDQMRRGWKRSRSESPSNLRPSTGHSGSTTNIAGESSNGGGEGGEGVELRDRSMHSASRTDLDSNFHHTESSTEHRRHSGPPPAGMNRSRSFPGFESSHNAAHYYNPDADTKVINDAEDFEFKPTDMKEPLHLSFCGCGFVGMYHLGVVSCLLARGETFLERVDKVAGSSAGALMAAVMLCAPDRLEDVGEQLQALARELRSRPLGALTPGYSFARALRLLLDDVLPEDAHLMVSGRLHISLTAAAGQGGGNGSGEKGKKKSASNELMTDFNTRDELVEALVATSYIPLYAGLKMPVIRGKKYMDGCFSDNMPSFSSGRTITVSPFDGRSDIAPKAGREAQKKAHFISVLNQEYQVNVRNMKKGAHAFFPPKRHVMQEYFDLGRYDASRFLIREGLYTIRLTHCAEKAVYVSSV